MSDLVQKLVRALEECLDDSRQVLADMEQIYSDRYRPWRLVSQRKTIADAEAALSAAKDGGWVAVPVEPTKEMIDRACADHGFPGGSRWIYRDGYKSMLAARPLPNPPKGEV